MLFLLDSAVGQAAGHLILDKAEEDDGGNDHDSAGSHQAPQFRISAPSKVLTATEIVVLSELLIKIME